MTTDPTDGTPRFEMEAQLVTASGFLSMFGKGRSVGVVRLTPDALTFTNTKGSVVVTQPIRGITALDFKKLTGCLVVSGDTEFKIYPPMTSTGSDIGDVVGATTGVASTYMLYTTLQEMTGSSGAAT